MELRFDGETVLVTGGGSGIGAAIARGFGAAGARVAVHYHRSEDGAREVVGEIGSDGGEAMMVAADLTQPDEVAPMVERVATELGGIGVLVNNAGDIVARNEIARTTDAGYDAVIDVNLRSAFSVSRAVIPQLRSRGRGSIVNISSVSARTGGGPGSVLYAAAKGALSTLTRGLAAELARDGIRVNAVSPGLIDTRLHERHTPPEMMRRAVERVPLGRVGRADECVGAVLFLASDRAASYVTGQIIEVNGGMLSP